MYPLFSKIAESGVLSISADDMEDMVRVLTVTDTTVEGEINGIPAGKNRFFTVSVFDSLDSIRYQGTTTSDLLRGTTVNVSITLHRVTANAVIVGTIDENQDPDTVEECTAISDSGKAIELISPKGGETFVFGSTVQVKWKVSSGDVDMVVVQISTHGTSGPWRNIYQRGIAVPMNNKVACMDSTWVIGGEYDAIDYSASGTVLLRVAQYSHESENSAVSALFTINK